MAKLTGALTTSKPTGASITIGDKTYTAPPGQDMPVSGDGSGGVHIELSGGGSANFRDGLIEISDNPKNNKGGSISIYGGIKVGNARADKGYKIENDTLTVSRDTCNVSGKFKKLIIEPYAKYEGNCTVDKVIIRSHGEFINTSESDIIEIDAASSTKLKISGGHITTLILGSYAEYEGGAKVNKLKTDSHVTFTTSEEITTADIGSSSTYTDASSKTSKSIDAGSYCELSKPNGHINSLSLEFHATYNGGATIDILKAGSSVKFKTSGRVNNADLGAYTEYTDTSKKNTKCIHAGSYTKIEKKEGYVAELRYGSSSKIDVPNIGPGLDSEKDDVWRPKPLRKDDGNLEAALAHLKEFEVKEAAAKELSEQSKSTSNAPQDKSGDNEEHKKANVSAAAGHEQSSQNAESRENKILKLIAAVVQYDGSGIRPSIEPPLSEPEFRKFESKINVLFGDNIQPHTEHLMFELGGKAIEIADIPHE